MFIHVTWIPATFHNINQIIYFHVVLCSSMYIVTKKMCKLIKIVHIVDIIYRRYFNFIYTCENNKKTC